MKSITMPIGAIDSPLRIFGGRTKDATQEEVSEGQPLEKVTLKIDGMHCNGCAATVAYSLKNQRGIVDAEITYSKKRGIVTYNPTHTNKEEIVESPIFTEPHQFKAEMAEQP
ncbi:MAG: heavy-metal-associated domain-containing protein [Candidatus Geothermarchaeales archaeon]